MDGIVICDADEVGEYSDGCYDGQVIRAKKVLWVTPQTTLNSLKSPYLAEATLGLATVVKRYMRIFCITRR